MAVFSIIKYEGPNDVLVWKAPQEDFSTKSQLIVHESQEAIFFKDGQALDLFGPGRHTLDTQNIPLLRKLVNLPFGGESPFHCEVYFINKVHSMDVRWGTGNRIPIKDPVYEIFLPVGASGQFAVQVEDSRKLLIKLVGTIPEFSQEELTKYFRGLLLTNIKDLIAKKMTQDRLSFLEIHAHLKDISDAIAVDLQTVFQAYGIRLVNFFVTSIVVPEDDPSYQQLQNRLNQAADIKMLGYTQYNQRRTFDVMEAAANNEGSSAGVMGAGLGLGMGVNLGSFMGQTMGQVVGQTAGGVASAVAAPRTCGSCGAPIGAGARFCPACGAAQAGQADGTVRCPNCGQAVPPGKFCALCGGPLQKVCPDCGTQAAGNFCPNCGKRLGG